MRLFKKKTQKPALSGMPDRERMRYELARNIYPNVIRQCERDAHTATAYRELPATAAKKTLVFVDALVNELTRKEGQA